MTPLWLGLLHLLMEVVDYGLHWMVVKEVASCLTLCTRVFLGDGSGDLELMSLMFSWSNVVWVLSIAS